MIEKSIPTECVWLYYSNRQEDWQLKFPDTLLHEAGQWWLPLKPRQPLHGSGITQILDFPLLPEVLVFQCAQILVPSMGEVPYWGSV